MNWASFYRRLRSERAAIVLGGSMDCQNCGCDPCSEMFRGKTLRLEFSNIVLCGANCIDLGYPYGGHKITDYDPNVTIELPNWDLTSSFAISGYKHRFYSDGNCQQPVAVDSYGVGLYITCSVNNGIPRLYLWIGGGPNVELSVWLSQGDFTPPVTIYNNSRTVCGYFEVGGKNGQCRVSIVT
jgi:hypothetical protein